MEARAGWFGAGAVVLLAATLLWSAGDLPGWPCLSRMLFGVSCPGCGLTRSMAALWRGDIRTSLRLHPMGLPLFTLCALFALRPLCPPAWTALSGPIDRLGDRLARPAGVGAAAGLLLAAWLLRLGLARMGCRFFLW